MRKASPVARPNERAEPVAVGLPLRGEWAAINTPAYRVPSHGTNFFAQTYAFDFVRLGGEARAKLSARQLCRGGGLLKACTLGIALREFYGYGEPIHAPFDGTVVTACDGLAERDPVLVPRDLWVALRNGLRSEARIRADVPRIAGNYLVLEAASPRLYAVLAHCKTGSVRPRVGERVARGEVIAAVGHSGNSTAPHLHFQLMDAADPLAAQGLPCCFDRYELRGTDGWHTVSRGIPNRGEVFRSVD